MTTVDYFFTLIDGKNAPGWWPGKPRNDARLNFDDMVKRMREAILLDFGSLLCLVQPQALEEARRCVAEVPVARHGELCDSILGALLEFELHVLDNGWADLPMRTMDEAHHDIVLLHALYEAHPWGPLRIGNEAYPLLPN